MKKTEFSKCILIFAACICAATWVIAAVSWLMWRDFPTEMVQYTGWFFGAVAAYMGKTAYENKPKIESGLEAAKQLVCEEMNRRHSDV